VLHKMVTVMKGGEEVKISKRAGSYLTLRELIDEAGPDAVRFFLVSRKADTEIRLRHRSRAIADRSESRLLRAIRACARSLGDEAGGNRDERGLRDSGRRGSSLPLTSVYEETLLRRLAAFPEELAVAARELAPHLVTTYLRELAAEFHSYYNAERFLVDDPRTKRARLALAAAAGQTIRNGLAVLGISAPEKM
jgi:arginyl-tRNA synthetase